MGEKQFDLSKLIRKQRLDMTIKKMGKETEERYQELQIQIESRRKELQNKNLVGVEREDVEKILNVLEEEKREIEEKVKDKIRETLDEEIVNKMEFSNLSEKPTRRASLLRPREMAQKLREEQVKIEETLEETEVQVSRDVSSVPKTEEKSMEDMTETKKEYQRIVLEIRAANKKIESEIEDSERAARIKSGMEPFIQQKKKLEAEMKDKGIDFTEILKEIESQEEKASVNAPKVEIQTELSNNEEKEMSPIEEIEKKINDAKKKLKTVTDEGTRRLIDRGIELYKEEKARLVAEIEQEEQREEKPTKVQSPKVIMTPEIEKIDKEEIERVQKRYQELDKQIKEARENLKTKKDGKVKQELSRAIQILEREKAGLQTMEVESKKVVLRERLEEDDLRRYVEQRLGKEQKYQTVFGKSYEDLTNEIVLVEEQLKDENLKDDVREEAEGRLQRLRNKMQEMEKQIEYGIKLYVKADDEKREESKGMNEKANQKHMKRKQLEVAEKRKGKATDRIKRIIKGYFKASGDLTKTSLKLEKQEATRNFKNKVGDIFFYGKQELGKSVKEIGHELKEMAGVDISAAKELWEKAKPYAERMKRVIKGVKLPIKGVSYFGKGKNQLILNDSNYARSVADQFADRIARDLEGKEDASTLETREVLSLEGDVEVENKERKDTLHRLADGVGYAKQKVGAPVKKAVDSLVQDMKESKKQYDYSREDKRVYRRQARERKVAHVKDIMGYAKDMTGRVFTNLRKMSPIAINHDAKSVKAIEKAKETVKAAGKQKVNDMMNSGKNRANEVMHKIADSIETKTQQNEEKLQQRQAELDEGKGEKGDL